ncbi:MAG: excinuclease ABC subunit UvrC [Bacilli bacterium]
MDNETLNRIKEKLSLVPNKPGCYQMKNKDGIIIYVGKAKKLKNRLSSYFRGTHYGKTAKLVSEIKDFEYIIVGTETESLIMEINLIKQYDPKYNILLRDDKSYPYIELTNDEVPKLSIVRNLNRKKNKEHLYGPYPNVTAARTTVNLLNRIYPLRKCKTFNKKPCLYYHIGECLGYCTHNVDKVKIETMKKDIIRFLNGDHTLITKKISDDIIKESEKLNFESAKELKELLDYINITLSKQKVEISDMHSIDVFGYYLEKDYLSIQVFFIRGGKIVERHSKIMPIIDELESVLTRYIAEFYSKDILTPYEILLPDGIDIEPLQNIIETNIKIPQKGTRKSLVEMANSNAKNALHEKFELIKRDEHKTIEANEELKNILNLEKLDRIELFDNAHLFGTFNVSGMVVFKNGVPSKNDYRKFKITQDKNDDYGTMREVLYRRYFRVLKDNLERPDLIIVDGGIGQINVALEIIDSLNMGIPIVGLKKNDKHRTEALIKTKPIEEIKIDIKSNLFHYLERMQEEVHNYTINYHRELRSKGSLESILNNVEGIGTKRKEELLKKYKTITKLKQLSIDELETILPKKTAKNLKEFLDSYQIDK